MLLWWAFGAFRPSKCCCGDRLVHFDLQIVALTAVLCVNVAVPAVLGVDFTLSRRSLGGGRDCEPRTSNSAGFNDNDRCVPKIGFRGGQKVKIELTFTEGFATKIEFTFDQKKIL